MSPRIVVVSWVADHGRSRGIAATLDAEAVFMPWARSRSGLPATVASWLRSARRTWAVVRAMPPTSVAVVMSPPVFAPMVALAAARHGTRVVVDAHSGTFNDRRWRWSHPLVRWVARQAALVLVTNTSVLTGFDSVRARSLVVHDPLDPVQRRAPPRPDLLPATPYVVFPTSGAADEPLVAVARAARQLAGRPLVVVTGRGSEQLSAPGLIGMGFLDDEAYRAVLHNAVAVLALTEREGTMQRAAYEGLEIGIPIVCSDTEVLRDALDGAAIFCHNDAASIAEAVCIAGKVDRGEAARAAAATRARLTSSMDEARQAIRTVGGFCDVRGETATPLVSVVIDNYNYARFLRRSIDSALAQTYRHVEVIVVDDGSTDDSAAIARSYGDRITLLSRPNGGQAAALNTGFQACGGDVVIFLDADDELYPPAAQRVVEAMSLPDTGIAKVHFRLDSVDADGRSLGFTNPTSRSHLAEGDLRERVLGRGRYVTPVMSGNAYPRHVLEAILPIPEEPFRISADGYLVALAALHGRIVAIDEPLGAYRIHGSNAWAPQGVDAARLHALMDHDFARYHAVAAAANGDARPVTVVARHDQSHLRSRLASLRLDPQGHPMPGDHRSGLALAGVRSALTTPGMSARQRLTFAAWFPVVAFAPQPLAGRAVQLLHTPVRRYRSGRN